MENKILSNNFSIKGKFISAILGVFLIISMSYLYFWLYGIAFESDGVEITKYLIAMGLAIEGLIFGAVLIGMNFNLKSNIVRSIAFICIGVLGTLLYYEQTVRIGTIILLGLIIIFILFVLVLELNTTIITMSVFSLVPIILIGIGVAIWPAYEIAII